MSDYSISKKSKILALVYLLSGLFFLMQVFLNLEIIPVKFIASFLGLPNAGVGILLFGIVVVAYTAMANIVLKFLEETIPRKRDWLRDTRLSQNINGTLAFINIWFMGFSFGIMAMIGIFPENISFAQVVNLYVFWFLLFKAISNVIKIKASLPD